MQVEARLQCKLQGSLRRAAELSQKQMFSVGEWRRWDLPRTRRFRVAAPALLHRFSRWQAPQVGSDARGSFKMASVFPKQPPVGTFPLARRRRCWLLGDELAYLIPVNQECLPERKRTNDGADWDQTKPRVSAQIHTHKTDISLHECHDVIQSKSATGTKAKMTTKL